MDINTKLAVLSIIYSIYEDFVSNLTLACEKCCALCCTRDVTLTTLEGYMILDYMASKGKLDLLEKVEAALSKKRFQPAITTNRLAELCVEGKELPDEESASPGGKCPLLIDNECPIYPVRPFGCRCLVSSQNCGDTGYADIEPFVISVNNLFLQTIEHIDSGGCFGNLTDILFFLKSEDNRKKYMEKTLIDAEKGLIPNQSIKILMIPPEHRIRIQPILKSLQKIKVPTS